MDEQIETLDPETEKEIDTALLELRKVKFSGTYTEAVEYRELAEAIIRRLAKRLTQDKEG